MEKKTDIKIIKRGEGWICVEKPGGISVHNEPGKDLISIFKTQQPPHCTGSILQPVHRLDKETWGLLLLATHPTPLARLSDTFARGLVKKRYKALVHGNFNGQQDGRGIWNTPLSKQAGGRKDPVGKGKKVRAETRYQVIEQTAHYALLDILLLTGRKHQIRRHAKLAGHPVTGDSRYGSLRAIKFLREQQNFHTMGLQSWFLEFEDEGKTISIALKNLPGPMDRLLKTDPQP